MGLGSGRCIGASRGGLGDDTGPGKWPLDTAMPGWSSRWDRGPGKWPVNRDRLEWPWKLERARKPIFSHPGDAR